MSPSQGLILGKFLPPHKGHEFLIDYAARRVDELTIVVDSVSDELIPVATRIAWMQQICPSATVLTLKQNLPQFPQEAPDTFWQLWENGLKKILSKPVDVVFASEEYGETLASVLHARFEMVDLARATVPISATTIRNDLYQNWDYLAAVAKPYFCKRVCIFGPESVGKSTLTEKLANYYGTVFVPEYARTVIEENHGRIHYEDIEKIATGHEESIQKALPLAHKLLLLDTDAITTKIWSQELFGQYPLLLEALIAKTVSDLYLVLNVDVPWVQDIVRFRPEERERFLATCIQELNHYQRKYIILSGNWEDRFQQATSEINNLFKPTERNP